MMTTFILMKSNFDEKRSFFIYTRAFLSYNHGGKISLAIFKISYSFIISYSYGNISTILRKLSSKASLQLTCYITTSSFRKVFQHIYVNKAAKLLYSFATKITRKPFISFHIVFSPINRKSLKQNKVSELFYFYIH